MRKFIINFLTCIIMFTGLCFVGSILFGLSNVLPFYLAVLFFIVGLLFIVGIFFVFIMSFVTILKSLKRCYKRINSALEKIIPDWDNPNKINLKHLFFCVKYKNRLRGVKNE